MLLPTRELPQGVRPGDELQVFVYCDSEDRPIATRGQPMLERGEVRFLTVTAVTRIGAFFDWRLPKELLVPFKEQTAALAPGQRHPIGLLLDRSVRPCGTMRVRELLHTGGRFVRDEIVARPAGLATHTSSCTGWPCGWTAGSATKPSSPGSATKPSSRHADRSRARP